MDENRKALVDAYWATVMPLSVCEAMSDKYARLRALARLGDEAVLGPADRLARKQSIRFLAHHWPASLREGELVAPARIRERHAACTEAETRSHAAWRERGYAAIPLWASLHAQIAELQAARRRFGPRMPYAKLAGLPRGGPQALSESETAAAPETLQWPDPAQIEIDEARPLSVRVGYLVIAYHCGMSLAELGQVLFEREGPWDDADDDPAWSRVPGPG